MRGQLVVLVSLVLMLGVGASRGDWGLWKHMASLMCCN